MPLRLTLLAALIISGVTHAAAEAPGLESLYPAGGRAGERIQVKVLGKGLDRNNPVGWCSNPAVTLQPVPLTGDKAKDKALAGLWHITIAKDAGPGPCLIRFHNNDGSSPPHIFEVGTAPEFTEAEPNDSVRQSSSSSSSVSAVSAPPTPTPPFPSPPVTLNGLLAKDGDADVLPIRVRKGIPLAFELHGYALGSPMDPAMRLLDERGIELAASHDTHNLDPLIRHTPAADTTLYVQVHAFVHPPQSDIAFKGSANHVYRLHVTESGKSSSSSHTSTSSPGSALIPPFITRATLTTQGQESAHLFHAKKGDDLQLTVRAKAIRSPVEAVLRLESLAPDGKLLKVLQTVDDASSLREAGSFAVLDPALHWKAPADGGYRIVVTDRFQNGGPHHHYELEVEPWQPSVTATLPDHAFVLVPGKTTDIKVTIAYDGKFSDKLTAHAATLPPGVTATDVELPAKNGEIKLTLKAAADAAPAQTPISIEIVRVAATPPPQPASRSESNPAAKVEGSASTPAAPGTSPSAAPRVTVATYAIPFKELRGDLLLTADTQPWLTVPKAAADQTKGDANPAKEKAKATKP